MSAPVIGLLVVLTLVLAWLTLEVNSLRRSLQPLAESPIASVLAGIGT